MMDQLPMQQWLLAEHVRCLEERFGRLPDDEAANALAKQHKTSLTQRIADRAAALPMAVESQHLFLRLKKGLRWLVLVWLWLALAAGVAAANMAVGDRTVEVLMVLVSVLALPTLTGFLWVVGMAWPQGTGRSSIMAHALAWLVKGLTRWGTTQSDRHCLMPVTLAFLMTPAGRWGASIVSHLIWLSYLLAAWLFLMLQLVVAQYDLGWGTTLLSDDDAISIMMALAWLPDLLGWLPANSDQWLAQGRLGVSPEAVRMPWAVFLLSLIVLYGILPRLLALFVSFVMWHRTKGNMRLGLNQPGYARLAGLLLDQPHASAEPALAWDVPHRSLRGAPAEGSGVFAVGIELQADQRPNWATRPSIIDLGVIAGRADRGRVLAALQGKRSPAQCLLVAVEVRRSPDKGVVELINQLADQAGGALLVVLMGVDALSDWVADPAARLADWQSVGEQTGARVIEVSEVSSVLDEMVS